MYIMVRKVTIRINGMDEGEIGCYFITIFGRRI